MQQLDFYSTAKNKKSEAETLLSDTSEEDDERPTGETTQLLIAHSPKK